MKNRTRDLPTCSIMQQPTTSRHISSILIGDRNCYNTRYSKHGVSPDKATHTQLWI
jgi:hypothetical protein